MTTYDFGKIDYFPRLQKMVEYGVKKLLDWEEYEDEDYQGGSHELKINDFCNLYFEYDDEAKNIIIKIKHYKGQILFSVSFCDNVLIENMRIFFVREFKQKVDEYGYSSFRQVKFCCNCQSLVKSDAEEIYCEECSMKEILHEEVCPICLDKEKTLDLWVELKKCKHIFHKCCIDKVLKKGHKHFAPCPMCREPFTNFCKDSNGMCLL